MNPVITIPADEMPNRADYPEKSMFFFDFDGVLADQHEEKVYRLKPVNRERDFLVPRANKHGIMGDLFNTNYLRHLVYQAEYLESHPLATPFVHFAREMVDPFCILTARSGFHAVKRLMNFIDHHGLVPQEIFCMGPSSKAQHLRNMLRIFPEHHLVFFDDSLEHIETASQIDDPRVIVRHVVNHDCWKLAEYDRKEMLKGFDPAAFRKLYMQEFPAV